MDLTLDPRPSLWAGELILANGLALQPSEGATYVRRLVEANVAALGFGTGLSRSVRCIVQPVTQGRVNEGASRRGGAVGAGDRRLVLLQHAVSLPKLELDNPRRLIEERNRLGANAFRLLNAGAQSRRGDGFLGDAVETVRTLLARCPRLWIAPCATVSRKPNRVLDVDLGDARVRAELLLALLL